MATLASQDLQSQLANQLFTSKSLVVSSKWLSTFISSQRNTSVPISALVQTALFRLLASDITTSLSQSEPSALFPAEVSDPTVRERQLPGPIAVQVIDFEDIGSSRWSQIEAIERVERGEETRGRELIRTIAREEEGTVSGGTGTSGGSTATSRTGQETKSSGPLKLLLQDASGQKVFGMEVASIKGIKAGSSCIGVKLILRNVPVARGLLLLDSSNAILLGGKLEFLETEWKKNCKAKLLSQLGEAEAGI